MRTFEYKFLHAERLRDVAPLLATAGKEGWEVICSEPDSGHSYCYLAKRIRGSDDPEIHIVNTADGPSREEVVWDPATRTLIIDGNLIPPNEVDRARRSLAHGTM